MKIRTHYDNLKIARNAPPEIIRAAYKALSQKYHPDRNPGSAEATRIMAIINAAYHTLSDPYKRQEHDQWIAQQEMMAKQAESRQAAEAKPMAESAQAVPPWYSSGKAILARIFTHPIFYGLLIVALIGWATDNRIYHCRVPSLIVGRLPGLMRLFRSIPAPHTSNPAISGR